MYAYWGWRRFSRHNSTDNTDTVTVLLQCFTYSYDRCKAIVLRIECHILDSRVQAESDITFTLGLPYIWQGARCRSVLVKLLGEHNGYRMYRIIDAPLDGRWSQVTLLVVGPWTSRQLSFQFVKRENKRLKWCKGSRARIPWRPTIHASGIFKLS